jgi:transforming growth factor-beta-induced protein
MYRHLILTAILVAGFQTNVFAGTCSSTAGGSVDKGKDIVDTAVSAGTFKTLTAALQAARLVETLKGKGSFTVLAPDDEAFARLPEGTVDNLLKPENKDKLTRILTYHVIPGKVKSDEVKKMDSAKTVEGQSVSIRVHQEKVLINGSRVIKADIGCSNGIIHVIDTVLIPTD